MDIKEIPFSEIRNVSTDAFYKLEGIAIPILYVSDLDMMFSTAPYRVKNTGGAAATTYSRDGETSHVILLFKELVDRLSDTHLKAILLHEEGHVKKGHVDAANAPANNVKKNKHGVFKSTEFELEADAYAAARVGGAEVVEALRAALTLAVENMIPERKGMKGKLRSVFLSFTLFFAFNSKEFRSRVKALS